MKKILLLLLHSILTIAIFFLLNENTVAETCDINAFIQKDLTIIAKTAKCVKAADLNGDGKLDIISASSGDNKLAWYEHTYNDRYLVRIIDGNIAGVENFDFGDLDNDGDIDIVAAAFLGTTINWYENDGHGNFTMHTLVSAYSKPRAVCVADIDSDGDLDVVATSTGAKTVDWFDNNGNKTFTKKKVATGVTAPWFVTTSDIDKDGDMDILAVSRDADLVLLYKNDGSENFTAQTIDNKADGAECVLVGDMNNDGNLDIAACSYWDNKIKWYQNDGSLNFTTNLVTSTANGVRSIFLADVDKDNDIDIVYGSYWLDKVAWLENDGSGAFTSEHLVSSSNNGPQFVSCCDMNGDNRLDYLTASADDNKISWSKNISKTETQTYDITYPSIGSETIVIADIDNDGDNDAVVTAQIAETVFWFENVGKNDFIAHTILEATYGIRYAEAADMNNDGHADIIIGEYYANRLSILFNDGHQNFTKTDVGYLNGIQCIAMCDINKDGRMDILTASRNDDKVCWFKQLIDGTFEEVVISSTADAASSVAAFDFDKDGDIDILSTSVNDDMSCWYENDGSNNFTKHVITDKNDYPIIIAVGDMNADGFNDCIVGSRNDNSVSLLKNDGSMNFTRSSIDNIIGWITDAIVEDLNYDGYPDIITSASKDNVIQWYKNDKAGGYVKEKINRDAKGAFFVDAADMDSDGDKDLVSSSFSDDKVVLYTVSTYKDNIMSLIYPPNKKLETDIYDTLKWSSVINATGYWVQASLDSLFNTIAGQDTVTGTNVIIDNLQLQRTKKYYWRVAATNGTCWTAWSPFRCFTIADLFTRCDINLTSGWNMISSFVTPKNDSLKVMLADIKANAVIIKDNSGKFYIPSQNTGTMKFWLATEGFKIYMSKVDTLQIIGKTIDPTLIPVKVKAGWNIIAYLRKTNMNAKDALASIVNDFVIVKNMTGKFYIPPSNNQIGNFLPGQGYQMYAKKILDLYYPANSGKRAVDEILNQSTSHYRLSESATGNDASLVLSCDLPDGIEIGIFNNSGKLIGAGVVINKSASIVLIGDDEQTDLLEGAIDAEYLNASAYNPINDETKELSLSNVHSLINNFVYTGLIYKKDEVFSAFAKLNSEFINYDKLKISPNPFDINTEVSFVLENSELVNISLYDVTGRLILKGCNEVLTPGIHKLIIDGSTFSSGTYRLIFQTASKTISEELVIVK